MVEDLPDDIIQLVCDQLLAQRDFATLYNCAVSSKRLAPCALSDIYRSATSACFSVATLLTVSESTMRRPKKTRKQKHSRMPPKSNYTCNDGQSNGAPSFSRRSISPCFPTTAIYETLTSETWRTSSVILGLEARWRGKVLLSCTRQGVSNPFFCRLFFEGPMKRFKRDKEIRFNTNKPARKVIDQKGVIAALGDGKFKIICGGRC